MQAPWPDEASVVRLQMLLTEILMRAELLGYLVQSLMGAYFVSRLRRIRLIHPNLKMLLIVKVTQYYLVAAGRVGNHLNEVVESKPLAVTNFVCMWCRVLHDTGLFISAFCPLWISIERSCATVMPHTYQDKSNVVGKTVTTIQHTSGLVFALSTLSYDLWTGRFDPFRSTFSCQLVNLHPTIFPLVWIGIALMFLVFSSYLVWLYAYNRRQKRQNLAGSLASRFQYNENVKTLRFLVPVFMGYGLTIGMAVLSLPYVLLKHGWQDLAAQHGVRMVYQFLYLMPVIYGVYYVAAIFYFYEPMRQLLRRDVQRCCPAMKREKVHSYALDADRQTAAYFRQLDHSWQGGPARGAQRAPAPSAARARLDDHPAVKVDFTAAAARDSAVPL